MGKALKFGGILFGLLALLAGGLFLFADPNQFRDTIQAQLETALNRKVTLGHMGLKLYPLSIRIDNTTIAEDPAVASQAPFLAARQILVRVDLMALLSKQVRVDSLSITEPVVELIRSPKGIWNFATLGRQNSGSASASGSSGDFTLSELRLDNGKVAMTDFGTKQPRAVYDGIDVDLRDLAPGKPFRLGLTVHLPQNINMVSTTTGSYDNAASRLKIDKLDIKLGGLVVAGSGVVVMKSVPASLDLRLKTVNSSITELARVAGAFGTAFAPDMKVDGVLDADLAIAGPANQTVVSGNLGLRQLVANRAGWKQPVRIPEVKVQLTPADIRTGQFTVESGNTRLLASANILNYSTPQATLDATLRAAGAELGELLNVALAYGVHAMDGISGSGAISLDVHLQGKLKGGDFSYAGSGSLKNATLKLATLKKPLDVRNADLKFQDDRAVLENLACSLGSSNLTGSLSIRNFSAPELKFNADIDQLSVAELSQLTESTQPSSASPPSGGKSAPSRISGQGKLSVGKLAYDAIILKQVRSDISIERGVLRLDPLTADLFGGKQSAEIVVDTNKEPASYSLRTKMNQVDANQLLTATTPLRQLLFGNLAADADLTFSPKPGEPFAKGLSGTFGLKLADGKLSGVSIMNEMANVAKLLGYRRQGEVLTNILKLSGNLHFQNGIANTEDLKMDFDSGSLAGKGVINLVDQTLNMRVTTVLAKAISDQFGGNKIAGILTSALQNSKGEIVIPSLVSGTAIKPIFSPDAKEIARMRVEGLMPTAKDPASMVKGVSGAIDAGRQGNVQGILDSISGRKKQETAQAPESNSASPSPATLPAQKKALGESIFDMIKSRRKKEEPKQP